MASLGTAMALCLIISAAMIALPTALLATGMTLSSGLERTGKVGRVCLTRTNICQLQPGPNYLRTECSHHSAGRHQITV